MTEYPKSPSPHPNISGREKELFSLSEAVRRLTRLTVLHSANPQETADFAEKAHALADEIRKYVPDGEFVTHRAPPKDRQPDPEFLFQYDGFSGPYNPLAAPLKLEWDPPIARGLAHFSDAYIGPPGCVHGGFIAANFDQVFTLANVMNGISGPTAKLAIEYRRPTPLNADLVFEAELDYVSGSRIHTKGALYHGDTLTAEATGLFIKLSPEKIAALNPNKNPDKHNRQ